MSDLNGWYQEGRPMPQFEKHTYSDDDMDETGHEFRGYSYGDGLVTSETGGLKADKASKLGYLDPTSLMLLGEVAGMSGPGKKYPMHNFLKGFDWSLSFNAMMRHALQFWAGEDTDEESGLPHMAHAAWHAMALVAFLEREIGKDDRPK